uniref:Ion_trans domain-containing protein n=1 Tax=Macrostomum lignano TaxID=282301 RepID=A0A1I8GZD1_9PLAT
ASSLSKSSKDCALRGGRLSTTKSVGFWWPTALNFLFILVTNVLLLNLLIAPVLQSSLHPSKNFNVVWPCATAEHPAGRLPAAATTGGRLAAFTTPDWVVTARHDASRRLRGVRRESAVLKFVYYLAVQAVAMRSKRAELYLGSNRSRHFTESTGETAAAATPAEQLQQQQPRDSSGGNDMKDLRSMLEKILQQQQQQQQQTLEVPPPPNYQLQVHATESSFRGCYGRWKPVP